MSSSSAPPFSIEARRRNTSRIGAILEHPFNGELAAGTLAPEIFSHYLAQDSHYLAAFGRAITLAAARAPEARSHRELLRLAGEELDGERELHASFEIDTSIEPGPATVAYSDFLLATVSTASFAEAVAALVPCYRVYGEVARRVAERATVDNPFRRWIETYDGPAFSGTTELVEAIADRAAAGLEAAGLEAMHRAYGRSVIHEWCFFDDAYRRRHWPI